VFTGGKSFFLSRVLQKGAAPLFFFLSPSCFFFLSSLSLSFFFFLRNRCDLIGKLNRGLKKKKNVQKEKSKNEFFFFFLWKKYK